MTKTLEDQLEDTTRLPQGVDVLTEVVASAAISLKRIADAQEHQAISLKRLADAHTPPFVAPVAK